MNTANSTLKPLKQAANQITEKYKKFEQSFNKLLESLQKEKHNGVSEVQRYFIDFNSFIKQNF